jgi:hypothetical protein
MSREIRMVPDGWQHPRDGSGEFIPMKDKSYKQAADEWLANCAAWSNGTHSDCKKRKKEYPYYWEWDQGPPDKECYRPEYTSEPVCYQIYEDVSEGTPVSPVFKTKDAMIEWLIGRGHSRVSAERFAESEWAPSMVMSIQGGKPQFRIGIDSLDDLQ